MTWSLRNELVNDPRVARLLVGLGFRTDRPVHAYRVALSSADIIAGLLADAEYSFASDPSFGPPRADAWCRTITFERVGITWLGNRRCYCIQGTTYFWRSLDPWNVLWFHTPDNDEGLVQITGLRIAQPTLTDADPTPVFTLTDEDPRLS